MKRTQQQDEAAFWAKVSRGGENDCWPWIRSANAKGYGCAWYGGTLKKAHRAAWEIRNGPILEGACVLHKCDNPRCCNPDHLFLGTVIENNEDMRLKGRGSNPPARGGWNKINIPDEIIRSLAGKMSDQSAGASIGVNKTVFMRRRIKLGLPSYSSLTGNNGTFKPGNYPARWMSSKGGVSNHP